MRPLFGGSGVPRCLMDSKHLKPYFAHLLMVISRLLLFFVDDIFEKANPAKNEGF